MSPPDPMARLVEAIVDVVRAAVRAEIDAAKQADPDDWIPHTEWPVKSRRVACELARSGKIKARRAGKVWVATRRDLEAFLAKQPGAPPPKPSRTVLEDVRAAMLQQPRRRRKAA